MMKKHVLMVAAALLSLPAMAQNTTSPNQRISAAVYGDPSLNPGETPLREVANPGWYNTFNAGGKEIVDYLERASGIPIAKKPDPGRVAAFSVHEVYEVQPSVAMAQHPLEGFGYQRPVPVGVPYSMLPQHKHKFIPEQAFQEHLQQNWWTNESTKRPLD